ncbi:MAG: hypothetical protein MK074_09870, partial [Phycisphaerales bacterium]|nr:hypothetical protein [Phycisphaerales bacterium]
PPVSTIQTPIWHPNFSKTTICIGDHWSPAEQLAHLIGRIGAMISYQDYNVKSPLNGEAARWAEKNINRFPVDSRSMLPLERNTAPQTDDIKIVFRDSTTPPSPPSLPSTSRSAAHAPNPPAPPPPPPPSDADDEPIRITFDRPAPPR